MKPLSEKVAKINARLKEHGIELRNSTGSNDYQLYKGNKWIRQVSQAEIVYPTQHEIVNKLRAIVEPAKMVDVRGNPISKGDTVCFGADNGSTLYTGTVSKTTNKFVFIDTENYSHRREPKRVCVLEKAK